MRVNLRRPRITTDKVIRILSDYSAGMAVKDIALRYGISVKSIYNIINRQIN